MALAQAQRQVAELEELIARPSRKLVRWREIETVGALWLQGRHRLRGLDQLQIEVRRVEFEEALFQSERGCQVASTVTTEPLPRPRPGLVPVRLAGALLHRPRLRRDDGGLVGDGGGLGLRQLRQAAGKNAYNN